MLESFPPIKTFPIPAAYFGMVLGISGMGTAWRMAAKIWQISTLWGECLMLLAGVVWLALAITYIAKWIWYRPAALAEVNDPIQCCYISLFPATTMLIGAGIYPYFHTVALWFVVVGTIGQLGFAAYRSAGLWRGLHSQEATTPGVYLPTVSGNLISAICLGALGYKEWGILFFGAGIFSWLSLESVILQRLRTMGALPNPLRPSIGIQLAPPLVACEAYLFVNGGHTDIFSQILFGYGLLQLIFLLRLLLWTFEQPFSVSFWAFSFGISALSVSSLHFFIENPESVVGQMAIPIFIFSNGVIALLILGTLLRIIQGKFLLSTPVASK